MTRTIYDTKNRTLRRVKIVVLVPYAFLLLGLDVVKEGFHAASQWWRQEWYEFKRLVKAAWRAP